MNVPYMTEQIVPTLKSFYSVLASLMLAEVESTSTNLHLRCAEHVVCLLVAAEVFLKLEGPMALVALIWLLVSLGMATVKHRRLVLRTEITRIDGDPPRPLPGFMRRASQIKSAYL